MTEGKDQRQYITLATDVMSHPKITDLSKGAFTAWLQLLAYSARHLTDGVVPGSVWRRTATPSQRKMLVVSRLIHQTSIEKSSCFRCKNDPPETLDGAVFLHDFLRHQSSRAEVDRRRENQRRGSVLTNHRRWHEARGVYQTDCPHCVEEGPPAPPGSPERGVARAIAGPIGHPLSLQRSVYGLQYQDQDQDQLGAGHPPRASYVCQRAGDKKTRFEEQHEVDGLNGPHQPPSTPDTHTHRDHIELTPIDLPTHHDNPDEPTKPATPDEPWTPDARAVLTAWATTCHRPPPAAVLTQLHHQVDQLLDEGFTHHELAQCLTVWSHKGLHPKTLPSVVHEVLNSGNGYANVTDANIALLLSANLPASPTDTPRAELEPGDRDP